MFTYVCLYFVIMKNSYNKNKNNGTVREYILHYLTKREAGCKKIARSKIAGMT